MITVDQYRYIRTAHGVYGKNIREIARETGHSRNTVKRAFYAEMYDTILPVCQVSRNPRYCERGQRDGKEKKGFQCNLKKLKKIGGPANAAFLMLKDRSQ